MSQGSYDDATHNNHDRSNAMTAIIILLDVFLGINGFLGGHSLMKDPTGSKLHMSTKWLRRAPIVKSYLLPGLFLSTVFGFGGFLAAIFTWGNYNWAQWLNVGIGLALIGWIIAELIYIPDKHILEPIFFTLGVALIVLPLL